MPDRLQSLVASSPLSEKVSEFFALSISNSQHSNPIMNYELRIEKAAPSLLATHYSQLATSPLWLASVRPESSAITDRGYRLAHSKLTTRNSQLATVIGQSTGGTPVTDRLPYTRSQASGGIQCASCPSHLTLHPIGFVSGILTGSPLRCSRKARLKSLTVIFDVSRGLSTPRPV